MTLYKVFNCKTKEELYQKVIDNDESVIELTTFIKYLKTKEYEFKSRVDTPLKLIAYFNNIKNVEDENIGILFLSNDLTPLEYKEISLNKDELRKALMYSMKINALSIAFYKNMRVKDVFSLNRINDFLESIKFNFLKINYLDTIIYDSYYNKYIGCKYREIYSYNNFENIKYKESDYDFKTNISYNDLEGYDEFIKYYVKEELINKDIVKDNDEIKNLLKLGYKDEDREIFGIIKLDDEGKIVDVKNITKGVENQSLVPIRTIYAESDSCHSLIAFHNHPSGIAKPSKEDVIATKTITKGMKFFEKYFDDHLIIGKNEVYSFSKDGHDLNCSPKYKKFIKNIVTNKQKKQDKGISR